MDQFFTFFFFSFMMICPPAFSQVQLGADLDGEAPGDQSGFSVSISANGSRLAIGTPFNSANGDNSGHVRVYNWDDNDWVQLGIDIDGVAPDDQTGASVSLSDDGSILAVGATGSGPNGAAIGQVRVFIWDGVSWTQMGASINGEAANDQFGRSISLSSDGNRVAIGSRNNAGNGINSGHVRVYQWNNNEWIQLGTDIDGEELGDQSGGAVSLSADGSRLAIGATFNNGNGGNAGHARVFNWDGFEWSQLGASINGEGSSNFSGWSVSLSADGSRLAVSAPANDGNGEDSGHVRVYDWDGMDWIQIGNDLDGEAPGDRSGGSVSLSANGNILAIGATENDGNGDNSGHVRLYRWDNSAWTQLHLDIDGEAPGDQAGFSVSLSGDGSRLAVSARFNDGNGEDSGHVRVFGNILTSTNQTFGANLDVFPNPTKGEIYFQNGDIDRVQMFDSVGRLIKVEKLPSQSINIYNEPAGIYFLKIFSNEMIYLVRLVKQ